MERVQMKRVNGQVKTPASKKQNELRRVSIGVLDGAHAGAMPLGYPPEKEPPPPG
jgi:hypothetical protein